MNLDLFQEIMRDDYGQKMTMYDNSRVFTPEKIAKQMVDMLPDQVWDPKTKFLDPCCKTGVFLIEIYNKLDEALQKLPDYSDKSKRRNHILNNQIFGIALDDESLVYSRRNVAGDIFYENIQYLPQFMRYIKDKDYTNIKKLLKQEEVFKMDKFDVVIGNPPYQENTGGGGNDSSATAIYHLFIDVADKLQQYMSFIIPSRWMQDSPNGIQDKWLEKTRNRKDFIKLVDYSNQSKVFDNVRIAGGVCYFLIKKDYVGKCYISFYDNDKCYNKYEYLANDGIIIRDMNISPIIDRIYNVEGFDYTKLKSMYNIMGTNRQFQPTDDYFKTSWDGFQVVKTEEYYIKYYANSRVLSGLDHGYVQEYDLADGTLELAKKYKLFMPLQGPTDNSVIRVPFIGGTNSCCSRTFAPIATDLIQNDNEANNAIKYFKTKFLRVLVKALKNTQRATRRVYKLVPLQDFTSNSDIDWSKSIEDIDKQLYRKYNLTQEEIDYIEKTIKPMK